MNAGNPGPRHAPEEPAAAPSDDDLRPDKDAPPGGNPENPGEPTPGSDNDGPEAGYTPPDEVGKRRHRR